MPQTISPDSADQPPSKNFSTENLHSIDLDTLRPVLPEEPPLSKLETIPATVHELFPTAEFKTSKNLRIPEARLAFIEKFYPEITQEQWNDWRWQLRNRIKSLAGLERILVLSEDERQAISSHKGPLPVGITPYYASLLDPEDPLQPLRRTVVKTGHENLISPGEADDPLDEEADMPIPDLVHRYPDRVLFLVTGFCSTYCRYCTRSRMVGNHGGEYRFSLAQWEGCIDYISNHPEVRDVLLSGGDPLTLPVEKLEWLLSRLRLIPHVEFIRIGSKVPAVLPQRITSRLVNMLHKYHPLWLSLHFTHPDELTPETAAACTKLVDAGIPLGSQTVLLKGINDNVPTMTRLFQGLLKIRVKPYYLYQCDPVAGSAHFRTTVAKGLEIISGLRGHTSGYAVPHYVIDAPGGGGKIPILPEYIIGKDENGVILRNYEGKLFHYPDLDLEQD
ncbi:MAG: KamA family radical SAM protein [Deltaproteobacteria bacterium]|nr:KamA family radical SAM protein [Deltaproteobacteria bacterium]